MVLNNAEQKLTWFLLTRIESIRVNYHLVISCNKVVVVAKALNDLFYKAVNTLVYATAPLSNIYI